jgi:hypothetical protein
VTYLNLNSPFSFIPVVLANNRNVYNQLSVDGYNDVCRAIPRTLVEYGQTPRQILDRMLTTKTKNFDLVQYKSQIDHLSYWIDFLMDVCKKKESLKKSCEEHMGWVEEYSRSVKKIQQDAKDWVKKNYDRKKLEIKFEKTMHQFRPVLQELRGIFYLFETELERDLYEALNVQFQKPNNPVSD